MQAEGREKESLAEFSAFRNPDKKTGPAKTGPVSVIFPAEQRTFRHPNDLICR